MSEQTARPGTELSTMSTNGRIGHWVLLLLAIPAQCIAFASLNVYMQGYDSWRDSLFVVPIYLVCAAVIAIAVTADSVPYARRSRPEHPVALYVIARLLIFFGIAILPVALALAGNSDSDWQPAAGKILYFIPLGAMIVSLVSGYALGRLQRWARVGAMLSVAAVAASLGVLLHEWLWLTATTPDDWFLFSISPATVMGVYLAIALPATAVTIRCLTRRDVKAAFGG